MEPTEEVIKKETQAQAESLRALRSLVLGDELIGAGDEPDTGN